MVIRVIHAIHLIAVTQDGNLDVIPITFAIVESKNFEYWEFFLSNLRRHVVRQDNVCLISDRSTRLVVVVRCSGVLRSRSGLLPKSYAVDLRNKHCECSRFQTLRYLCAHVNAACAYEKLDVKHFIDEVYMLQCTLHIWGNEFPVMPDVSNWEAPSFAFKMLLNRSLRRHPKG
ncbi:hypothetical protein PVK06_038852 [Gossypium arboreum]|uniref:SWIM-type domain-containing protein n=1 Tax=Gossypium arboreum TaxID=29729 RepID=A0ABR0N194_GOSAR|nr:hypothetical protein PVK06_038852 [Gossypium arboreum]